VGAALWESTTVEDTEREGVDVPETVTSALVREEIDDAVPVAHDVPVTEVVIVITLVGDPRSVHVIFALLEKRVDGEVEPLPDENAELDGVAVVERVRADEPENVKDDELVRVTASTDAVAFDDDVDEGVAVAERDSTEDTEGDAERVAVTVTELISLLADENDAEWDADDEDDVDEEADAERDSEADGVAVSTFTVADIKPVNVGGTGE
jgi:hypothetical protein